VNRPENNLPDRRALYAALGCYAIWGLLTPVAVLGLNRLGAGPLEIPLLMLTASAIVIAVNWGIFIWAVGRGQVLKTSLGYYLNLLLNMAAGALFFGERFDRTGGIAIVLATLGVVIQTAAIGHLPFISLALGLSFCAYGILRKRVAASPLPGLFVECVVLAIPGLLGSLWLMKTGSAAFGQSWGASLALPLMGPLTVVPLALFSWSARRMSLSALGFVQFTAPTLSFLVGVAVGEPIGRLRLFSFAFIWSGVAVFIYGLLRRRRETLRVG
jgi:chloramphenicol-sensitive protein RarD